ncbi:hypothetical protein [Paraburkholderia pallida]|nr:hypothetical protein [Paraburkholderia pallida]
MWALFKLWAIAFVVLGFWALAVGVMEQLDHHTVTCHAKSCT